MYNRFLAWCGYDEVAATIEAGWRERDRDKTTGALTDALIDRIAIFGSAAECQERVRALGQGGITTHVIACPSREPADIHRTLEAFAPGRFAFG